MFGLKNQTHKTENIQIIQMTFRNFEPNFNAIADTIRGDEMHLENNFSWIRGFHLLPLFSLISLTTTFWRKKIFVCQLSKVIN